MWKLLLVVFFFGPMALATKPAMKRAAPVKTSCTAKEIARKDCRLFAGGYDLRLLSETIAWNDGTWRTVDPMPLKGEKVKWEKAGFQFFGDWPILQLWIWDEGTGEAPVQSLHWFVADAEKRKLTVLATGVVRKRRQKPIPVVEGEEPPKSVKPEYLVDAMEPHQLKALKNGNLEWSLARDTRILERKVK